MGKIISCSKILIACSLLLFAFVLHSYSEETSVPLNEKETQPPVQEVSPSAQETPPAGQAPAASAKAPLNIDTEASCIAVSCHDGMGKKKYVHGVGVNGTHCIKCHEVVKENEHTFQLPEQAVELCAQCHSGQYIAPVDVKGAPPEIIASTDVFEEGEVSRFHKPFSEGKCTACHDAHESDHYLHLKQNYPKGMYAVFSLDSYALCLSCHKAMEEVLTEPRTLTSTKFRNGNLNLHYRHVNKKKGRSCKACHHPHGSENPKLLRDNFMFGLRKLSINYEKTDTGGSCAPTCHVSLKYDRYQPHDVLMIVSPRPGKNATQQELQDSMNRDMVQKEQEKQENEQAEAGGNGEGGQNE